MSAFSKKDRIGRSGAVSADGFEFAQIFMNDRQKALLSDSYTLVSATDTDPSGKLYSETYKSIGENGAYILNSGLSDEPFRKLKTLRNRYPRAYKRYAK